MRKCSIFGFAKASQRGVGKTAKEKKEEKRQQVKRNEYKGKRKKRKEKKAKEIRRKRKKGKKKTNTEEKEKKERKGIVSNEVDPWRNPDCSFMNSKRGQALSTIKEIEIRTLERDINSGKVLLFNKLSYNNLNGHFELSVKLI